MIRLLIILLSIIAAITQLIRTIVAIAEFAYKLIKDKNSTPGEAGGKNKKDVETGTEDNKMSTPGGEENKRGKEEERKLWTISWCHFNGPSLSLIYSKFLERSGKRPVFFSSSISPLIHELYSVASSSTYIRDMKINTLLSSVLEKVMEDCWNEEEYAPGRATVDLTAAKEYLDEYYKEKITLEELAQRFFIDKAYLSRAFKHQYGINLMDYLTIVRINKVKELLRFGVEDTEGRRDAKLVEIAELTGFSSENYLSMRFKKIEGISPSEYRDKWK